MFVLASLIAHVPDAFAVLGVLFGAITLVGLGVYARRFLEGESVKSLLDQKDEVIETLNQNVEALVGRVELLERAVQEEQMKSVQQQAKITELENKLALEEKLRHELEQYTAPKLADEVLARLDRIDAKLAS